MQLKITLNVPEKLNMDSDEMESFISTYLGFFDVTVTDIKRPSQKKSLCIRIRENMTWNYETGKYEISKELGEELILK
ncbi:MAG: hypothetical protein ACTSXY_16430 [Promethearchaeota archaeon]